MIIMLVEKKKEHYMDYEARNKCFSLIFIEKQSYIVEFDRFGFMRLNKQCKQLLKDNILYGKNEITLER